jgi:hypothetical protein
MPSYMLLLYNDPANWQNMSPEDIQKAIQKFMAWGGKLRTSGIHLASHKLADDAGKVIRGRSQVRVTDGPYSETKEVLGGYYLIKPRLPRARVRRLGRSAPSRSHERGKLRNGCERRSPCYSRRIG